LARSFSLRSVKSGTHRRVDAQPPPQGVEQMHAATGASVNASPPDVVACECDMTSDAMRHTN
jgi:hypothetical protein